MIGVLELSKGILCRKEALGKQYDAKIGGIKVKLSFPSLNYALKESSSHEIGPRHPLLAPNQAKGIKLWGEEPFWGYPMILPELDSVVKCVMIEIEPSDGDFDEVSQILYDHIGTWEIAFLDYYSLCMKEYGPKQETGESQSNLILTENGKEIRNRAPQRLGGRLHSRDDFFSYEQVLQAIAFASSGKSLHLEYQMLLSAYKARDACLNRLAIMDASAAVEICLTKVITKYCDEKHIDTKILLGKYRGLGDRFNLVEKIDMNFPKHNYRKDIVEPRNKVAHPNEEMPSSDIVNKLIHTVEAYLSHYCEDYY